MNERTFTEMGVSNALALGLEKAGINPTRPKCKGSDSRSIGRT